MPVLEAAAVFVENIVFHNEDVYAVNTELNPVNIVPNNNGRSAIHLRIQLFLSLL
jgi:hypothetical protein